MKKPDFSALKPMLFQYGDKVVLGLTAVATLLLVGMGLLSATSASGTDWAKLIEQAANTLDQKIKSAPVPEFDASKNEYFDVAKYKWARLTSKHEQGPLIHLGETPDIKRRNPVVLAIKEGEDQFQMYSKKGLYYSYPIDVGRQTIETFGTGPAAAQGNRFPAANPGAKFGQAMPVPMGPGAGFGAGRELVQSAEPIRMVVVNGVFPMKDQVEQFKMAFRMGSQAELFATTDLPRPIAVDVYRYEVVADGKLGPKVPLYVYDSKTEKVDVARPIADVLRRAVVDEENLLGLDAYVHSGLVTPLPMLANETYDKLNLPAFELPPVSPDNLAANAAGGATNPMAMRGMAQRGEGAPVMPGGAAGAGGAIVRDIVPIKSVSWRQLGPEMRPLTDRFEGKYDPFNPLAQLTIREDPAKLGLAPGAMPAQVASRTFDPFTMGPGAMGLAGGAGPGPGGFQAQPMPGPGPRAGPGVFRAEGEGGGGDDLRQRQRQQLMQRQQQQFQGQPQPQFQPQPGAGAGSVTPGETWKYDALVRFIDVGVEPGKTYVYEMAVRMSNPNFGRKAEVAFEELSKWKELPSMKPTRTPAITIPAEYHVFAVDQVYVDNNGPPKGKEALKPETAALQVHRWFEKASDLGAIPVKEYSIGDWGIAERLALRRGEFIGHPQMIAEVPVWSKERNSFEIPQTLDPAATKKDKDKRKPGVPLDFVPPVEFKKRSAFNPSPLLIDFTGGKKEGVRLAANVTVTYESAVQALIMTPDGKLTVRNSRDDGDPSNPDGQARQERIDKWREQLRKATPIDPNATDPNGAPGLALPGVGNRGS